MFGKLLLVALGFVMAEGYHKIVTMTPEEIAAAKARAAYLTEKGIYKVQKIGRKEVVISGQEKS